MTIPNRRSSRARSGDPRESWSIEPTSWIESLATILAVLVFGLGWGLVEGLGRALLETLAERPADAERADVLENRYDPTALVILPGGAIASTRAGPSGDDPLVAGVRNTVRLAISSDERGVRTRRWTALETGGSRP